jgi:hypothetical protein
MMKVDETQVYKCTLVLSENEAKILKGMMQNACYSKPSDEPEDVKKFREQLFNAINVGT